MKAVIVAEMERPVTILAIVFVFIQVSVGYVPRFHNGRPRGGMVKPPVSEGSLHNPSFMWMEQQLDHFNDANTKTWKQRYFVNATLYKPGSPVFLMISGEAPASPAWMEFGAWTDYAKVYNAMLFQLEHRFYGMSQPTPDVSVDSLQYLSSEQALADLAAFIQFAKVKYNVQDNVWISFGGSYAGALSAWLRMKYPHLISGSVASSAPVLAQLDFKNYAAVVRDSLATTGPGCDEAIQETTTAIEEKMQSQQGRDELKKLFNLCMDIDVNNKNDIATLFKSFFGYFAEVVQYNNEGSGITIDTMCGIMRNSSMDPIDRYVKINQMFTAGEKCVDFNYSAMVDVFKTTSWNSIAAQSGMRQWVYQTCTEFGYYQSSDLQNQPFGHSFPLSYSVQECMDIYGSKFNKDLIWRGINRTNTNYGGLGIKVTNIVLPNGSIDPWHALGIRQSLGPSAIAIYINGTAHCANMEPAQKNDPPGLIAARATIQKLIGQWIK